MFNRKKQVPVPLIRLRDGVKLYKAPLPQPVPPPTPVSPLSKASAGPPVNIPLAQAVPVPTQPRHKVHIIIIPPVLPSKKKAPAVHTHTSKNPLAVVPAIAKHTGDRQQICRC